MTMSFMDIDRRNRQGSGPQMGKNKQLRLAAKATRQAESSVVPSWVQSESLPPPNESHCAWTGPLCQRQRHPQPQRELEPEPEPELPLCTLPEALRLERLHRYDTASYPFAKLIGELILPESFEGEMHEIHRSFEVENWMTGAKKDNARAYTMRRNYVDKRYKNSHAFQPGTPTGECYLRFLRAVVMPAVHAGLGGGDSSCAILFQRDPNFRCHLPDTGHLLVHKHCDADYHHQQNEINFWLPITRSFGNNTLWSESAPGREDFRPFEHDVGEMKQFWGNQCVHYTVPNDTDHTRITVDFRVIPLPQ